VISRTPEEREAARRERQLRRAGDQDGHGDAVPPPLQRRAPSPPRYRRRRLAALLGLLVLAVVVWFAVEIFQPFHGSGGRAVLVTIPAHSHVGAVADRLSRAGVIGSTFFFEIRVALEGDDSQLHAGTYKLRQGMGYGAVLSALTAGPPPARTTAVTIIPGETRRHLDQLLQKQGVAGSYYAQTRTSPLLDPSAYGAPAQTGSLEGFLFPDTYQLREPISIPTLVRDQLDTFKRQFSTVNFSYARAHHLTRYDVLIVASMIVGEAQKDTDQALVASVIYNRLARHMPLQIDATTRYATGNYTQPLTKAQLNSSSPYNTRIHPGLPPTPIDNPGLGAIQAAAHPAHNNYLYFVVKPCAGGALAFASTYQQFLKEQHAYQQARARLHRSPIHC
jgi:uncharacterized YceG family protein